MTSVSDDGINITERLNDNRVSTPMTPVFDDSANLDSNRLEVENYDDDGDSCQNCPDCIAERESAAEQSAAENEDEVSLKVSVEKSDPDLVSLPVVSEPASPTESNLDVITEAGLENQIECVEEEVVEAHITPITRDYAAMPKFDHCRQASQELIEEVLEKELRTPILQRNAPVEHATSDEVEEEEIVPLDRTKQRSAFDKIQQISTVQEPPRQVSPVFQERPGPKFSSLADVPVVYCDSDDESSESNYRSSGVRVEVRTTDELLDEVRNSVEDISLENIQYVETMSDDTEIDEESISTGPSETEADIFSDETESDYPVEGPTYRAVDPSKPVSAQQNNQVVEPISNRVDVDESEYFTSDSERPADDEAVSKVEELVDQALEQIEENITSDVPPTPIQVDPSDTELVDLDEVASQSEVSFVSEMTDANESKSPVKFTEHVFRPATVYKNRALEITDDILEKSLIQLQSEMIAPVDRRFKNVLFQAEPLSRDSPIDYSLNDDHQDEAELEAISHEKHTGDFFLKQRFSHLSDNVRDSPIDFSKHEVDEEEALALKAEKDDGEPIDFEDDMSIDEMSVCIDSDDTESKAESIVDELEIAAIRRASRASSAANYHCEHDPVQVKI